MARSWGPPPQANRRLAGAIATKSTPGCRTAPRRSDPRLSSSAPGLPMGSDAVTGIWAKLVDWLAVPVASDLILERACRGRPEQAQGHSDEKHFWRYGHM